MQKYIFPLNYNYSGKFLGFFDYKNIVFICIYGAFLLLLLYLIKLSFFISLSIFVVFFLPPAFLFSTNINNESIISFLITMYKFKKFSKVYLFKKDCKFL